MIDRTIWLGNQAKAEIEGELRSCMSCNFEAWTIDGEPSAQCQDCIDSYNWTAKEETNQTQLKKEDERFQDIEGAKTFDGEKRPLTKSQIIRCPLCNSSNVYLGIAEKDGIHVLCYACEKASFVKVKK